MKFFAKIRAALRPRTRPPYEVLGASLPGEFLGHRVTMEAYDPPVGPTYWVVYADASGGLGLGISYFKSPIGFVCGREDATRYRSMEEVGLAMGDYFRPLRRPPNSTLPLGSASIAGEYVGKGGAVFVNGRGEAMNVSEPDRLIKPPLAVAPRLIPPDTPKVNGTIPPLMTENGPAEVDVSGAVPIYTTADGLHYRRVELNIHGGIERDLAPMEPPRKGCAVRLIQVPADQLQQMKQPPRPSEGVTFAAANRTMGTTDRTEIDLLYPRSELGEDDEPETIEEYDPDDEDDDDDDEEDEESEVEKKGVSNPLNFDPFFAADEEGSPWGTRDAVIPDAAGGFVYHQQNVRAPKFWTDQCVNIVASKYFWGEEHKGSNPSKGGRERDVEKLIYRVASTIGRWAYEAGIVPDRTTYTAELRAISVLQIGAFNSPVWFNVGLSSVYGIKGPEQNYVWDAQAARAIPCDDAYAWPQCSACFIQPVHDDMRGIMKLATSEALLFKHGSGSGTDLSTLRSSRETVQGGGRASGPVSFMRVYDAIANVVKSGGKTRRAAKMQTLKVWHPDILKFIDCKRIEDKKARDLMAAGWSNKMTGADGEAYTSVGFQNANLSVRATDEFLSLAEANIPDAEGKSSNHTFPLKSVTTGETIDTVDPLAVMDRIALGCWTCGDPGMQYEDTIQRWHTCSNTAPINSSNPCGEYNFIDDSACNLYSIRLTAFQDVDGFATARFCRAVSAAIVAQESLVDNASYPTPEIAVNSHRFRPLGLGYADLGALLMTLGTSYDSDAGRALAGAITALMHAQALYTSAKIAERVGPFDGFAANRDPMLRVVGMHVLEARRLYERIVESKRDDYGVMDMAQDVASVAWSAMILAEETGKQHGFRNSQVTLLAPTGTISFLMDCDTTGVEPAISLVSDKAMSGGGQIRMILGCVDRALETLGYVPNERTRILEYVYEHGTIEGSGIRDEFLPVFDCAFPSGTGTRSLSWESHIKMMAAVQPFLSGAISKTVNMPESSTVEDVRAAYFLAWKLGLKSVAIYRDGSKFVQPVTTRKDDKPEPRAVPAPALPHTPQRERLPTTRRSLTHKFMIDNRYEFYVHAGLYHDGRVGEVWIDCSKEGSTLAGLMNNLGVAISIGLQYGIPLRVFVDKFCGMRYEPHGWTDNRPDIPIAKSPIDYLARWLGITFIPGYATDQHVGLDPILSPLAEAYSRASAVASPELAGLITMNLGESGSVFATTYESMLIATVKNGEGEAPAPRRNRATDAPICDGCGTLTVPSGAGNCYRCPGCGNSIGCS